MEAHCTSLGKCLIAHIPDEDVDRLIAERGLLRHNEHTIVSPARLKQELARVRTVGYALDDQEEELGGRCIGAPVRNRDGRAVAAISVAGTTEQITAETITAIAARVRQAAGAISKDLGYRDQSNTPAPSSSCDAA